MGLFSSLFGSGNKSAYDTTGVAQAVDQSNKLYGSIYDESKTAGAPWLQAGQEGAGRLEELLGLGSNTGASGYGSLAKPFDYNSFTADPSYQFIQDEANQAVQRQASAGGSLYAPSTAKALQDRAASLASTEYNNAFTRDMSSKTSLFDMLNGVSGAGQNQAGMNAQLGSNYADAVSGNNIGLQNAILSSYGAKNANTQSMLSNWINLGGRVGAAAAGAP